MRNFWAPEQAELRQAVLRAIAEGGHEQRGPSGNGFVVAVARKDGSSWQGWQDIESRLAPLGIVPRNRHECVYFPICSDNPAERLRHSRRPGERESYWMFLEFDYLPNREDN